MNTPDNIYNKLKQEALDMSELHEVELGTPDTEKSYQEKELNYQMKATGNRSQTATPDTEWEKEFDEAFSDESGIFEGGDPFKRRRGMLKAFISQLLTSRGTYWKERVRKEVEKIRKPYPNRIEFKEGISKTTFRKRKNRTLAFNQALDTLLDNLK